MAKNHTTGAPHHSDPIDNGSNGHCRKVVTLPIRDRSSPNDCDMQGKIGNRTYFIERHVISQAPTNELQADKAFCNGRPYRSVKAKLSERSVALTPLAFSTTTGKNLQPDRYERSALTGKLKYNRCFSSRLCTFVRIRSRDFCGLTVVRSDGLGCSRIQ
jgi:hypothetical protein